MPHLGQQKVYVSYNMVCVFVMEVNAFNLKHIFSSVIIHAQTGLTKK